MTALLIALLSALRCTVRSRLELEAEIPALRYLLAVLQRQAAHPPTCGTIVQIPHLGGLHHHDGRRAA